VRLDGVSWFQSVFRFGVDRFERAQLQLYRSGRIMIPALAAEGRRLLRA
jgi:hypothetical protein